ncbi:unnamed protein product [Alternaria alternata]
MVHRSREKSTTGKQSTLDQLLLGKSAPILDEEVVLTEEEIIAIKKRLKLNDGKREVRKIFDAKEWLYILRGDNIERNSVDSQDTVSDTVQSRHSEPSQAPSPASIITPPQSSPSIPHNLGAEMDCAGYDSGSATPSLFESPRSPLLNGTNKTAPPPMVDVQSCRDFALSHLQNFQRQNGTAQYGVDGVGYGGPIQVALTENPPPQLQACIPTLTSLGLQENLESLNGNNLGVMYQPATYRASNHTRSYSVDYIPEAGDNLAFMFNTTVHRVQLNTKGSKATGVVLMNGTLVKARREVIVAAGSLLSPKILELSGIGQRTVLNDAGIKQVIELPGVGENLQDHLRIQTTYELKPDVLGVDVLKYNTTLAAIELERWKRGQPSLYQYAGSCYGFLKWKQALGDDSKLVQLAMQSANMSNPVDRKKLELLTGHGSGAPDIEVVFSDGYIGTTGYPKNGTTGYGKQYVTLLAGVQHPFARGSVHINGSDPLNKPLVNPRYLSTSYDLEALISAAKYTRRMAKTAPFKNVWVSEFDPGMDTETNAEWEMYIRDNVFTFYHPLGTCAMLPKKDGGVVDPKLRVYGVGNLRVVDASVIPMIISAHIQTAIYGIAERAAEIITAEYR